MKVLRFIFYILRNGSLKGKPLDFEQRKAIVLQSVYTPPVKSFYNQLRNTLIKSIYLNRLIAVLAYIKNYKKNNKQFFFIDSQELCYIRIFKAASTSILRGVLPRIDNTIKAENFTDQQLDLLADYYVKTVISKHQEHYTYFTVVRNPFRRIVSVYLDLFDEQNTFFSYQVYFMGILKKGMTFSEFIDVLAIIPTAFKSLHFAPQHQVIKTSGVAPKVKFFRVERDMHQLTDFLLAHNLTLHHSNQNKKHYAFQKYYDQKTARLVYEIYKEDIEMFGYVGEYELLLRELQTDSKNIL